MSSEILVHALGIDRKKNHAYLNQNSKLNGAVFHALCRLMGIFCCEYFNCKSEIYLHVDSEFLIMLHPFDSEINQSTVELKVKCLCL